MCRRGALRIAYLSRILLDPYLLNECSRFRADDYVRYLLRFEQQRLHDLEERTKARQLLINTKQRTHQRVGDGHSRLRLPIVFHVLSTLLLMGAIVIGIGAVSNKIAAEPSLWSSKDYLQAVFRPLWDLQATTFSSSSSSSSSSDSRADVASGQISAAALVVALEGLVKLLHSLRNLTIYVLHLMFVAPFNLMERLLGHLSEPTDITIASALSQIFKSDTVFNSVIMMLCVVLIPSTMWLMTMQSLLELSMQANNILTAATATVAGKQQQQQGASGFDAADTSGLADLASWALRAEPTHEDEESADAAPELIYSPETIAAQLIEATVTATAAADLHSRRLLPKDTVVDDGWTADGPDTRAGIEFDGLTASIRGRVVLQVIGSSQCIVVYAVGSLFNLLESFAACDQAVSCHFPAGSISVVLAASEGAEAAANALLAAVSEDPRIPNSIDDIAEVPALLHGSIRLQGRDKADWNARSFRERLTFTRPADVQLSVQAGAAPFVGTTAVTL